MRISSKAFVTMLALLFATSAWGADFKKGHDAYSSGDYQTALSEWQVLAEEGHADAQFGMGLLYANGFGVSLDDNLALKWYRLAADKGHGEAQCNLAVMYANGWGVTQSDEEALKWYSLAADGGITQAQVGLARMYLRGLGTGADKIEAHKWFAIAASLGDSSAAFKRDELAAKLSAEEISAATSRADAWMQTHQNLLANH